MLELFTDLEEYIGEAIYSLAKQGTDQSMAETIRQFIMTQACIPPIVDVTVLTWTSDCHPSVSILEAHCLLLIMSA